LNERYDYLSDPALGPALAYWQAKRGCRSMPSRSDIDPIEVPSLLPHLQLIDIVDDRFRFRLIGSELVYAFGRDYTGFYVDELFDGPREINVTEVYRAVRERRQPAFMRSQYFTTKDIDLVANRLYLPLSTNDRDVNMILGAMTFEYGSDLSISGIWGKSARLTGSKLEFVDSAV